MDKLVTDYDEESGLMRVKLSREFEHTDWKPLIDLYKEKVESGVKNWELDLSELEFINSSSIGTLVALNTSMRAYEANMRILLKKDSNVAMQIRFAKIDRVLSLRYVDQTAPASEPASENE